MSFLRIRCLHGLGNCISWLSSWDERMKCGQHYQTPKNNNSFANTNLFLKDYFIYFLVKAFSLSALFSLEEVRLRPSHLPTLLIRFFFFTVAAFRKFIQNTHSNRKGLTLLLHSFLQLHCLSTVSHFKGNIFEFSDCMTQGGGAHIQ